MRTAIRDENGNTTDRRKTINCVTNFIKVT